MGIIIRDFELLLYLDGLRCVRLLQIVLSDWQYADHYRNVWLRCQRELTIPLMVHVRIHHLDARNCPQLYWLHRGRPQTQRNIGGCRWPVRLGTMLRRNGLVHHRVSLEVAHVRHDLLGIGSHSSDGRRWNRLWSYIRLLPILRTPWSTHQIWQLHVDLLHHRILPCRSDMLSGVFYVYHCSQAVTITFTFIPI